MGARLISRILLGALAAAAFAGVTGQAAWADDAGTPLGLPVTLPVPVNQDPLSAANRIVAEVQRRANDRGIVDPVHAASVGSAKDTAAARTTGTAIDRASSARASSCTAAATAMQTAAAAEDRAEARQAATEDRIERELQRLDRIEDRIEARHARAEDRAEQALMRAQARVQTLSDRLASDACTR